MKRLLFCLSCLLAAASGCSDGDTMANVPPSQEDDDPGDGDEDTTEDPAEADDSDDNASDDQDEDAMEDDGEDACETTLHATIRDFKFEHPDFENDAFKQAVATPGLVQSELGPDAKPVFATVGVPVQLTDEAHFREWYRDTAGVNQALPFDIALLDDGTGKFVYDNQDFFPIDGKGLGDEGLDLDMKLHNFAFTTEIHTEFEYKGGEVFTFVGDDDLWLFINGKLAIDLGGLHPKLEGTVNLDAAAQMLGISPGKRYKMDIFHAERHTEASRFRIETTIDCLGPVIL
jgi:fibro-slime domain-containing protein